MSETLGLKNVNLLSKEQYSEIAEPSTDELYAISGSGFGFPSDRYIDLELGASATGYTAPANGWFYISMATAAANQYFAFENMTKNYQMQTKPSTSGSTCRFIFPVQKNDVVKVNYTATGTTYYFRFIYAEGE